MLETKLNKEFIKLDQLLKLENIASTGGEAKMMILDGLVKVNGVVELARGKKIRSGDLVEVFDEKIKVI